MTDQSDLARAARAESLLSNTLITEAFDMLEAEYVNAWRSSQLRDAEGREHLWQAIQIVGKVKHHLEQIVIDGTIAQAEIDEIGRTPAAHRK